MKRSLAGRTESVRLCLLATGLLSMTVPGLAAQEWSAAPAMSTPRMQHGMAAVAGKLVAVGGRKAACDAPESQCFANTADVYDPAAGRWTPGTAATSRRANHAVVAVGNLVYAMGGDDYVTGVFSSVVAYDPASDRWISRRSMPTKRSGLAAAVASGLVYVAGGFGPGNPCQVLEVYDPVNDSWTPGPPMPRCRTLTAAAALEGRIYVIGGRDDRTGEALASVDVFDPETASWSSGIPLPLPRWSHAAAVVDGKVHVAGGFRMGAGTLSSLDVFDPATGLWTTGPPLRVHRAAFGIAGIGSRLYVAGGGQATPQGSGLPPVASVESLAAIPENAPPSAVCLSVTVSAGDGCQAAVSAHDVGAGSSDPDGDALTLTMVPAGPFGLGETVVTLHADDGKGGRDSCTATVNVVDTDAPSMGSCPAPIEVFAPLGSSAVTIDYTMPAVSDACGQVSLSCSTPPGSSFAVGTTTVVCTAADSSGNRSSCSFPVSVRAPQDAARSLAAGVQTLVARGLLDAAEGHALASKVDAALKSMDRGSGSAAANQLKAFINQVTALVRSGRLPAAEGEALAQTARQIIDRVG